MADAASGRLSRVVAPDPAAVMAAHEGHLNSGGECMLPSVRRVADDVHCPTYRLAEALAAEQAKVARAAKSAREVFDEQTDAGVAISVALDDLVIELGALADQPEQEQAR